MTDVPFPMMDVKIPGQCIICGREFESMSEMIYIHPDKLLKQDIVKVRGRYLGQMVCNRKCLEKTFQQGV